MVKLRKYSYEVLYHDLCCESKEKYAAIYIVTPIITFDHPLWWKSLQVIEGQSENSPLRSIGLRLCGLHTEMSFIGSIGHLMAGSGLRDLLETVYSNNAVTHMWTGKAVR